MEIHAFVGKFVAALASAFLLVISGHALAKPKSEQSYPVAVGENFARNEIQRNPGTLDILRPEYRRIEYTPFSIL